MPRSRRFFSRHLARAPFLSQERDRSPDRSTLYGIWDSIECRFWCPPFNYAPSLKNREPISHGGRGGEERKSERERQRLRGRKRGAPRGEIQSRGRECANAIANAEPLQFCSCSAVFPPRKKTPSERNIVIALSRDERFATYVAHTGKYVIRQFHGAKILFSRVYRIYILWDLFYRNKQVVCWTSCWLFASISGNNVALKSRDPRFRLGWKDVSASKTMCLFWYGNSRREEALRKVLERISI